MMKQIRTRFAPSPTGFIHVGGVRTALFAWLISKQQDGKFILRIEDTDKAREIAGAEEHIQKSLAWLGIEWDEGTDIGGPHAPYRQSERLEIYKEWAQKLVDSGRAYADPYTKEELQSFRDDAKSKKQAFLYKNFRPQNPPKWDGTQPLRFKSEPKKYSWNDAVLGELSAGEEAIDDFILIKGDGYPTYNFCHIIDDMLMEITHVIRSQEFIASVPKFLNLYEALQIAPPIFATLPFVMAIDGQKKLSKRDGAKDILDYARGGYLPEAMVNFLATLGWNDGTEQEIFTKDELIKKFSLARVQGSPARFDEQRLHWMNGAWIRNLSLEDLYLRVSEFWPSKSKGESDEHKKQILALAQQRMKQLSELPELTSFFFEEPTPNLELISGNKQLSKLSNDELKSLLTAAHESLNKIQEFNAESIQVALNKLLEETSQKPGILFSLIRVATTWAAFSPSLPESLEVLGNDKVTLRLKKAVEILS